MPPMLPEAEVKQDDFHTAKPGQWDKRNWSDLEAIANRTRRTVNEKGKIDVDLIPDIWARHILFANALYDDEHMLHASAKAAFRGFLAVLALRSRKGIVIREEELRLDDAGNWPFAIAARNLTSGGHGIHQIFADTTWNEVYLFRGDGNSLIGVTSPLTLVCPAQGAGTTGLKNLPSSWWDGFRFRDPSAEGVLDVNDRNLLAAWISKLRTDLANYGSQPGAVTWNTGLKNLLHALGEFETALSTGSRPAPPPLAESPMRLGQSAYRFVAAALRSDEIRLGDSDLLLDDAKSLSPVPVLLPFRASDRDVTFQPLTDPSKVTVVTGTSLADIDTVVWGANNNGEPNRILAGRNLPEDAHWIDPKTLFLNKLYLLKGTQHKSGMNHAKGQREVADQVSYYPLMPFTQELVKLLPASQIVENVRFSMENHGAGDVIRVKLRLPLRAGKLIEVAHTYSAENQVSIDQIPVLEVWPPFRRAGWKHYHTFWWSNSDSGITVEPFPLAKEGVQKEQTETLGRNRVSVTSLDGPPEGFLVKIPHPQRGKAEMLPAGLIINKLMDVSEIAPSGTWSAGLDFGTSSTHLVLRSGKGGGEHPLNLAQSGPLRIVTGYDAERFASLYQYFLPFSPEDPSKAETSPFLSFLRMRHPEQNFFEPIADAHVLFYNPAHNVQELGLGRLATNLKWDDPNRSRSRAYLQQIGLQAAAEAVFGGAEGINWFYSLPAAFSTKKRNEYRREWVSLRRFIADRTGLAQTQGSGDEMMVESFATARYFKEKEGAPPEVGAVFLDIGGGTTDISIWQQTVEKCGLSVHLAGRDLFLAPLFEMRKIALPEFARIDPEHLNQATVNRLIGDDHATEFFAHAEAMLRDAGTRLAVKLHDQQRLEAIALPLRLGITGLFYYVGMILRHLESAGEYSRDLGGVYIGGNGSQLLHWADDGQYDPDGSLASLLLSSLFAGAQWTDRAPKHVQIKLSAKPKQEVATGLVVESRLPREGNYWTDLIAGEPFTLPDGSSKAETDRVSREQIRQAKLSGLPQLNRFYDNYLQCAKSIGYPPLRFDRDRLFSQAEIAVRQYLADQKKVEEEELDSMPTFIKALQTFVTEVAKETGKTLQVSSGAHSGR